MLKRAFGSSLDDGPVSHRVAEGDTQLNQRCPSTLEFQNQVDRRLKVWIASGDKGNESFVSFAI
jgi:hypothetical protein